MKSGIVGCAVLVLACGNGDDMPANRWAGTIDTLESGTIVVRNQGRPVWDAGEAWILREAFRLGRMQGDSPDVFGEIRDLEIGRGGEIYVLDSQASEIRAFGPTGSHLVTFGRSGRGPGELSRPAGMALDSDETLWVMNWGNARYSGFDPNTGELRQEVQRQASYAMIPWPGRFDASDRLLDIGLGADREPAILRLDSSFIPRDTLSLPRADDANRVVFRRDNMPVMSATVPFAPQPHWAAHPENGIVVGAGEPYELHHVNFEGDTTTTIEVASERIPVTNAERDSALAAFQKLAAMAGGEPDRQPQIPAQKAAHGAISIDDQRRIWVKRTPAGADTPAAWDIIGSDGRLLGAITLPLSSLHGTPMVRGDRMAIVTLVDDVPTVIVYDIVDPTGAT